MTSNVERVFPALRKLAGLIFAIPNILPEIDGFLGDHFSPHSPLHIFKANHSIAIQIQPIIQGSYLGHICHEAPLGDDHFKAFEVKVVLVGQFPHCKGSFERFVLVEGFLNKALL